MGSEEKNCDMWGLSLSLRPPITEIDDKKVVYKRESHFLSIGEKGTKMQKQNKQVIINLEEETSKGVGSPNSTLSSNANVKRFDNVSDDEDGGSGSGGGGGGDGGERRKLRLSKEQIVVLENAFKEHTTLNTRQKMTLARQVNLKPRQVEVWFQNRRARTKLKQTEVDCEYLRRFCETLTEQNKKLQKEVQELRAMKGVSANQSVVHGKSNHPGGSTANMCPSCKSVSLSSFATTSNLTGVLHRPVPLNLKKLSLTINNNNNTFEAKNPCPSVDKLINFRF